jgi:hypothetical protein
MLWIFDAARLFANGLYMALFDNKRPAPQPSPLEGRGSSQPPRSPTLSPGGEREELTPAQHRLLLLWFWSDFDFVSGCL